VLTLLGWKLRVVALTRPLIWSQFRRVFRAAEDKVASLQFEAQFYASGFGEKFKEFDKSCTSPH
jgi:hypothetical protein